MKLLFGSLLRFIFSWDAQISKRRNLVFSSQVGSNFFYPIPASLVLLDTLSYLSSTGKPIICIAFPLLSAPYELLSFVYVIDFWRIRSWWWQSAVFCWIWARHIKGSGLCQVSRRELFRCRRAAGNEFPVCVTCHGQRRMCIINKQKQR